MKHIQHQLWIRTPQAPGSRLGWHGILSTDLLTDYHHNSIVKLSLRWCVWKVEEVLPDRVWPKTLKWVVLYSYMWRYASMDITTTGLPSVCILWRGGLSCPVSAAWLSCVAKQVPSRFDHMCLKATWNPNKQTNKQQQLSDIELRDHCITH